MGFTLENDTGTNVWTAASTSGARWTGRESQRREGPGSVMRGLVRSASVSDGVAFTSRTGSKRGDGVTDVLGLGDD